MPCPRQIQCLGMTGLCLVVITLFFLQTGHISTPEMVKEYNKSFGYLSAAKNSTLGFGSLEFIALASEHDRLAALSLQTEISGLEFSDNEAVSFNELGNRKGIPPSSRLVADGEEKEMALGPTACLLSHMKLWRKLLASDKQTMFIVESDAMWGVNVREESRTVAAGLHKLQAQIEKQDLPEPHPNDPFNSKNWDVLSYGACFDGDKFNEQYVIVDDPEAIDENYYDFAKLHEQRVIRRNGGMICTTAYGVSRRGAMKMLLRAALNSDKPVDLWMTDEMRDGNLVSYGPWPMPIVQWEYKSGLGADRLNSNVNDYEGAKVPENSKELWAEVMKSKQIWINKPNFGGGIKHSALLAAADYAKRM